MKSISISLVLYKSDIGELCQTLKSLVRAVRFVNDQHVLKKSYLTIIDNGKDARYFNQVQRVVNKIWDESDMPVYFKNGHGNIGYGRAHNLGILPSKCCFYLVLNPDVILKKKSISNALAYMSNNTKIGLLVPKVYHENGEQLYLIKRYPSLFTLFIHGSSPFFKNVQFFNEIFKNRLEKHCLIDIDWTKNQILDDELVSGCFMFFRKKYLWEINGFSNDFFLYFEDYDLSKRFSKVSKIAYVPNVEITHLGGGVVKKGLWHIQHFLLSSFRFYSKYGWKFY